MRYLLLVASTLLTLSQASLASDNIVLNFNPDWECGPCKLNNSFMKSLNLDFAQNVTLQNIIISDHNQELLKKYNISGYPTVLYIKDGKIIDRQVGFEMDRQIKARIENNFGVDLASDRGIRQMRHRTEIEDQHRREERRRAQEEATRVGRQLEREDNLMRSMWTQTSGLRTLCENGLESIGVGSDIQNKLCKTKDPVKAVVCFVMNKRQNQDVSQTDIAETCQIDARPTFECVENNLETKRTNCRLTGTVFGYVSRWTKHKCDRVTINNISSKRCEEMDSYLYDLNIK